MTAHTEYYEHVWHELTQKYRLSSEQIDQFKQYEQQLLKRNKDINLTAITDPADIILFHFQDSVQLSNYIDFNQISAIADIGTGAGFPGIPLKILFPHLQLFLLEVNQKKVTFLHETIELLGLKNVIVCDIDWRTFLRKTSFPIDLFLSRASLHPDELVRIFKPSCPYHVAQLVYWASKTWQPGPLEMPFIQKEETYVVGNKTRRFIFFANN